MVKDNMGGILPNVAIELRTIEDSDIPLVAEWLNKEYVRKWYYDPEEWLNEIHRRRQEFAFLHHYIVLCQNVPIGFCQYYLCADAGEDEFRMFPEEGTYSIDYMIGEEAYLGKGIGKIISRKLCDLVFSLSDASIIVVQPDPANLPSCRTLLAAGFTYDEKNKVYIKTK